MSIVSFFFFYFKPESCSLRREHVHAVIQGFNFIFVFIKSRLKKIQLFSKPVRSPYTFYCLIYEPSKF